MSVPIGAWQTQAITIDWLESATDSGELEVVRAGCITVLPPRRAT